MRAISSITRTRSAFLVAIAVLAAVSRAARYDGPFTTQTLPHTMHMEPGRFQGTFRDVLQGQFSFPLHYPSARVRNINAQARPLLGITDAQVFEAVRQAGDDRQFILLGPPFPGQAQLGYSVAFPVHAPGVRVSGHQHFAFLSVEHMPTPRVSLHGFTSADGVPRIASDIANVGYPVHGNIRIGSVLTARELFRDLGAGWTGTHQWWLPV